ncbi:MAG TPA: PaaI family thioesterase [Afipia sp.]
MTKIDTPADIPSGFARHPRRSPLTEPWEPIYSKTTPDAVIIGLRLAEAHTNSRGLIHGGLIAALADNAMGLSCSLKGGLEGIVTINLSVDFLGSAKIGQWLAFKTDFIKIGGSICFAQCFVTADGEPCARANATFKIPSRKS